MFLVGKLVKKKHFISLLFTNDHHHVPSDHCHNRSWDAYDLHPNRCHHAGEEEDSDRSFRSGLSDRPAAEDRRQSDTRLRPCPTDLAAAGTCRAAAEEAEDLTPVPVHLVGIDRAEGDAAAAVVDDAEVADYVDCNPPLPYRHVPADVAGSRPSRHAPAAVAGSHPSRPDDEAAPADIAVDDYYVAGGANLVAAMGRAARPPPRRRRRRPRRLRNASVPDSSPYCRATEAGGEDGGKAGASSRSCRGAASSTGAGALPAPFPSSRQPGGCGGASSRRSSCRRWGARPS
jgi:hypothetical protein